jgi:hypothetical protein
MPWPGTPESQQSPSINPPSMRVSPQLSEKSTMGDVANAVNMAMNGLTVHEQAFASMSSTTSSASTTETSSSTGSTSSSGGSSSGVTSFNANTGAILFFPGLGYVNDQLGVSSYSAVQGDSGKKIIVGDSSPVAIYLDSSLSAPWFTIIDNDSSSTVNLTPTGGSAIRGDSSIYAGCFGVVYFDGETYWSGSTPIATDSGVGMVRPDGVTIRADSGILSIPAATESTLGVVMADGVSIGVDSGTIYSHVSVGDGPPSIAPGTPGNPFYFDSGASPWNGYVWWSGNWNRFG